MKTPDVLQSLQPATIIFKRLAPNIDPPEGWLKTGNTAHTWEGPKDGFIAFSLDLWESQAAMITALPYRLVEVARDEAGRYVYCMREQFKDLAVAPEGGLIAPEEISDALKQYEADCRRFTDAQLRLGAVQDGEYTEYARVAREEIIRRGLAAQDEDRQAIERVIEAEIDLDDALEAIAEDRQAVERDTEAEVVYDEEEAEEARRNASDGWK